MTQRRGPVADSYRNISFNPNSISVCIELSRRFFPLFSGAIIHFGNAGPQNRVHYLRFHLFGLRTVRFGTSNKPPAASYEIGRTL